MGEAGPPKSRLGRARAFAGSREFAWLLSLALFSMLLYQHMMAGPCVRLSTESILMQQR